VSGCKSADHWGFDYTQSDFVVSHQVLFMQTQTSCNHILLASLCCNLRLGAIYTVTSSFDIDREATGQEAAIPAGFCLSASLSPLALVSGVSGGKGEDTEKRSKSEGTESV